MRRLSGQMLLRLPLIVYQGDANSVDSGGQPIQLVYGLLDPSTGNANQIGITATMSEKVLAGAHHLL